MGTWDDRYDEDDAGDDWEPRDYNPYRPTRLPDGLEGLIGAMEFNIRQALAQGGGMGCHSILLLGPKRDLKDIYASQVAGRVRTMVVNIPILRFASEGVDPSRVIEDVAQKGGIAFLGGLDLLSGAPFEDYRHALRRALTRQGTRGRPFAVVGAADTDHFFDPELADCFERRGILTKDGLRRAAPNPDLPSWGTP